jgi:hypothetical protein
MLFILVMLALAAFAGAMLFVAADFSAAVPVHLALASGAMPLIAGAMVHFVPVLTRSAPRGRAVHAIPWLVLLAGMLVFTSFVFPVPAAGVRDAAATLGIVSAALLAWWIVRLSRKSLGRPHPGVYWYLAALLGLLLGLITVLLMHLWPEHYPALRRFHLHLNTLGFIGITAVGTLQVLLPTAVGLPDAKAALRLRNDLKWVIAGTLLIATGAAWQTQLVWPGLVMWFLPLLRLAAAWWALYRDPAKRWNDNATAIAGALLGFMVMLTLGAAHSIGSVPVAHASVAYVFAFLLPLVTGAASYLLPLWIRPGMQTGWHAHVRQILTRFSLIRVVLFISAGVITALWGTAWGWMPAAVGLMLFAVQLRVLVKEKSTPGI